jgi:hypothetical protein
MSARQVETDEEAVARLITQVRGFLETDEEAVARLITQVRGFQDLYGQIWGRDRASDVAPVVRRLVEEQGRDFAEGAVERLLRYPRTDRPARLLGNIESLMLEHAAKVELLENQVGSHS